MSFHILRKISILYKKYIKMMTIRKASKFTEIKIKALTTYSNTNVKVSLVCTMSWSVTIFACFNSFKRDASRIAVNGAPSSSCSLISFSATTWFVRLKGTKNIIMKNYCMKHDEVKYEIFCIVQKKKINVLAKTFKYCCIWTFSKLL